MVHVVYEVHEVHVVHVVHEVHVVYVSMHELQEYYRKLRPPSDREGLTRRKCWTWGRLAPGRPFWQVDFRLQPHVAPCGQHTSRKSPAPPPQDFKCRHRLTSLPLTQCRTTDQQTPPNPETSSPPPPRSVQVQSKVIFSLRCYSSVRALAAAGAYFGMSSVILRMKSDFSAQPLQDSPHSSRIFFKSLTLSFFRSTEDRSSCLSVRDRGQRQDVRLHHLQDC